MLSALKRPAATFGNAMSRLRAARGFSSAVASYPKSRLSVLPNGVRVVTEETLPAGDSATVGVWIDAGTRYETKETNGVAHFLEHMAFKGTTKRSQRQLEVEVENLGGHLNAYTSRENTVYYAKVFKKDVPQAVDILADILQNSKFDPAAIDAERSTILREAKEVDKEKEEVVFDRLHETAYDRSSLGWTILGPEENIASIQREHLQEYIKTHYTGPRMVIAGAGAIQHEELVKLATQLFGNVPAQPPAGAKINLQPAIFTGSDIRVRYDDMEEAHIAYGFPTAGWRDPDHVNLQLIQQMLGSFTWNAPGSQFATSNLVKRIVDEKIATKMNTFNTIYSDTGLFGIYAVSEKYVLQELADAMTEEMTRLSYKVTEEQLAEAKTNLKSNLLLNLDGTTQACEEIGRQVLTLGRRVHPAEMIARIDAVDTQSVKNTAIRFFRDHDFALAALGPVHELPDYNYLRRRTYWMRY